MLEGWKNMAVSIGLLILIALSDFHLVSFKAETQFLINFSFDRPIKCFSGEMNQYFLFSEQLCSTQHVFAKNMKD